MSALIKLQEIILDEYSRIFEYKLNKMIVVPFIKSFVDEIQESQMKFFINDRNCKELGIDISSFDSSEINTMKKIDTYSVYYSDDKVNEVVFQHRQDAEKFLAELKSNINDFYKNADAYIKFIN